MKYLTLLTLCISLFLQSACLGSFDEDRLRTEKSNANYYRVTKVVDGDTFWIDDGSVKGKKVRLIGIDAPESRKTGRKEVGYFGKEAKHYLTKRLEGQAVRLERDVSETDRYGRLLAYAYLEDGTFLNAELVKEGYAQVYTFPPDVKYEGLFIKLQREARKKRKGLWGETNHR